MIQCPKCSSYGISGPKYRRLGYGGEALFYTCDSCGYSESRPTHDAQKMTYERVTDVVQQDHSR